MFKNFQKLNLCFLLFVKTETFFFSKDLLREFFNLINESIYKKQQKRTKFLEIAFGKRKVLLMNILNMIKI